MKINRLQMIATIERMVIEREEKALAQKMEALQKAATAESDYVHQHAGDWSKLADNIRRRNRLGQPIALADVPEGIQARHGWDQIRVFKPIVVNDSEYVPDTRHLTNILAVLQACPDETISTSDLERLGAPLKALMRP